MVQSSRCTWGTPAALPDAPEKPMRSPRATACPVVTVARVRWQYAVQRLKRGCESTTPTPQPGS